LDIRTDFTGGKLEFFGRGVLWVNWEIKILQKRIPMTLLLIGERRKKKAQTWRQKAEKCKI